MTNLFEHVLKELPNPKGGSFGSYYSLPQLEDSRIDELPFLVKYMLESAVRNCDNDHVTKEDVEKILNWAENPLHQEKILFKPARVILQDFTRVPAGVDLVATQDALRKAGCNLLTIDPQVPVDLVIKHPVGLSMERAIERNIELLALLDSTSTATRQIVVVPPGAGIVHQVNQEYLAQVVVEVDGLLYPDSVVSTDSHSTLTHGLGILGWGESWSRAKGAMRGEPIRMDLPQVVGVNLTGRLRAGATATDVAMTCMKPSMLNSFVEFYGEGMRELSVADRATVANLLSEFGATMGFFPVDSVTLQHLRATGRDEAKVEQVEAYMRANHLFMDHATAGEAEAKPKYSTHLQLDLATVEPCVCGPRISGPDACRPYWPHRFVKLKTMKSGWDECLSNTVRSKGFGILLDQQGKSVPVTLEEGVQIQLKHGSVVIAAITSCTSALNPAEMLTATLVAKKASERGLQVKPYVKTSLAPASNVVTKYLEASGLLPALEGQGFHVVGYGCTTCIGNSAEISESVIEAISSNGLVAATVQSCNRASEGHVHPLIRANYLASPPLVVAYALAGTVVIDFDQETIGTDKDGKEVFLRDIWPSNEEVAEVLERAVLPQLFQSVYEAVREGATDALWNSLPADNEIGWRDGTDASSLHLLSQGDSDATDQTSPAGQ